MILTRTLRMAAFANSEIYPANQLASSPNNFELHKIIAVLLSSERNDSLHLPDNWPSFLLKLSFPSLYFVLVPVLLCTSITSTFAVRKWAQLRDYLEWGFFAHALILFLLSPGSNIAKALLVCNLQITDAGEDVMR